MTVATAVFATDYGGNLRFVVFLKILQGAVTALIPPGLKSITQGIVGSVGMTGQVSQNEMQNHLGTGIMILIGSLLAFGLYPNIGLLFIVSPIACAGVICHLSKIRLGDIDHNAARGLKNESSSTTRIESFDESGPSTSPRISSVPSKDGAPIQIAPSFNFGSSNSEDDTVGSDISNKAVSFDIRTVGKTTREPHKMSYLTAVKKSME